LLLGIHIGKQIGHTFILRRETHAVDRTRTCAKQEENCVKVLPKEAQS